MSSLVLAAVLVGLPAALLVGVAALRVRWLAVGLVPLSFPVGLQAVPHLPLRLVQVAVLAAVGLTGLRRLTQPSRPPAGPPPGRLAASRQPAGRPTVSRPAANRSPLLLAAGCTVLTALLASTVAVDPAAAIRLDVDYLLGLALAGTILLAEPDRAALRALLGTVCIGGGVICAGAVVTSSPLTPYYNETVVSNRATGIFGQPNELGCLAAVVGLVSLAWLLSLRPRHPLRLVAVASLVSATWALLLSLSRGAWIGAVLGLVVLLALVPHARRRLTAGLVAVAVVLLVAGQVLGQSAVPGASALAVAGDRAATLVSGTRNPYDLRPQIWHEALRQIDAHPWLGVGPGGYPVLAAEQPTAVHSAAPTHAHSLLLTVFAEQGVLGLLGLLATVLVGVLGTVRVAHSSAARVAGTQRPGAGSDLALLAGPAAGLAVVLGQGVVDYPLRNQVLELLVWLLVGLLAATGRVVCRPEAADTIRCPPLPATFLWFQPAATGRWPVVPTPRRAGPARSAPVSASGRGGAGRSVDFADRRRCRHVRRTRTAG